MEVEVVFPHICGAFYKASIVDINLANGTALLAFENDWKANTWVELAHVRYPPVGQPAADINIQPGANVEAFLPHHNNEPAGWWMGTLVKSKGELHVVEFQSGSEKYQDIVEHDKLRMPSSNPPLSKVQFYQKEFPVPEEIQEFCKRRDVHRNFRTKIRALCVSYNDSKKALVVLTDNETCIERAVLLIDIHFKDLGIQKSLLTRNEIVAQRVSQQQQRQLESGLFEQRFFVPGDLVGLAIGKEGINVNEVRRMDGIVSVEFEDHSSMFRVRAETQDALARARERLQYAKDTVLIPRNLAGKVIGKRGDIIQVILEKSKVNNVRVVGDEEAKQRNLDISAQVPFDFIGRKSAIENAKMMLEYHLDHLKQVESILQTRREMDSQLQQNSYGDTPTYYPRPGERDPSGGSPPWSRRGRGRGGFRGTRHGDSGSRSEEDSRLPETSSSPNQQQPLEWGTQEGGGEREEEREIYYSSEDSDSSPSVEEEGEEISGEEQHNSPPEDDRGPDRRRQRGGYRGRRGRGRGRGGWGGRGYRGQRPPRQDWQNGESGDQQRDPQQERSSATQDNSPKPQRGPRGGRRGRREEHPQSTESRSTDPSGH